MGDKICESVVPQLYSTEDYRVLKPGATVSHEGATFSVENFGDVRPVVVRPDGVKEGKEDNVLLFQAGYMMPPTSVFGDRFIPPLIEELKEHNGIGVFYSPFGRGTENPEERIGRVSADEIRREVATCIKIISDSGPFNTRYPARVTLGGHSLGGQTALSILGNPEEYGFTNRYFSGALAYCPIPVPDSRAIALTERFGSRWNPLDGDIFDGNLGVRNRLNSSLFTGPVRMGTFPVLKSLATGNGVHFDKEKARKFFGVEDDEVLDRLFGDSGVYFLQTLLTNSSEAITAGLRGKVVSIMTAHGDPMVSPVAAKRTAGAYSNAEANVTSSQVPGGHFAPFFECGESASPDTPQTIAWNRLLLDKVLKGA